MSENTSLRIIFAGTPEFAARHLAALLASRHEVVCVYTQPDRPAGRGKKLTASPVKALAAMTGKPVLQPLTLKTAEAQSLMAEWRADLMVVVAYGLLLPQAVLDIPRLGCINVHASLLPRWRGAAPIQRAIEAGDAQTPGAAAATQQGDAVVAGGAGDSAPGLEPGPMSSDPNAAIEHAQAAPGQPDSAPQPPRAPMQLLLSAQPERAKRGERFNVTGRLLTMEGSPLAEREVRVTLAPVGGEGQGRQIGAGMTNSRGVFQIEAELPASLAIGRWISSPTAVARRCGNLIWWDVSAARNLPCCWRGQTNLVRNSSVKACAHSSRH